MGKDVGDNDEKMLVKPKGEDLLDQGEIEKKLEGFRAEDYIEAGNQIDDSPVENKVASQDDIQTETIGDYKKPRQKTNIRSLAVFLLIIVLVWGLITMIGAFLLLSQTAKDEYVRKDNEIMSLKSTIVSLQSKLSAADNSNNGNEEDVVETCEEVLPGAAVVDNIISAIKTSNTEILEEYMAQSVDLVSVAGDDTISGLYPSEAISGIDVFISSVTLEWEFDLPLQLIEQYSYGPEMTRFGSASLVGLAGSGQVIGFVFDCNAKISTVVISDIERQLLQ